MKEFFTNIFGPDKPYLEALGMFVGFLVLFGIFHYLIIKHLEKIAKNTKTDLDDALIRIVKTLRPPFYTYIALYIALHFLELPDVLEKTTDVILIGLLVLQAVKVSNLLIEYVVGRRFKENDRGSKSTTTALSFAAKTLIWSFGLLFMLSNLGVDVTSLIAGLGIGGIAVALALQNILGDLFSSFAIYFDKPFVVGDFIIVGDKLGVVEKIGIKTTRIKALQGEEIVMSNRELTNATIQNFKKMQERRVSFKFGLTYDTDPKKLKKVPDIVKGIISNLPLARFDRAHFFEFGDFSLNYEVVYYLSSADYNDYMNTQQEINIKMLEAIQKEKVEMAFPTQTIHVQK